MQLAERDHQAERDGGSRGRDPQSRVPGEDRPHHRTGKGIHRTAGHCGRAVCASAGTRSHVAGSDAARDRGCDLRPLQPESTEDDVPRSIEGAVLSIGDKADTIAGMFSLGLVPSGSKDPFALRRQANGIVKVIADKKLPLHLSDLMRDARAGYKGSEAEKKFVDDGKFDEAVRVFFRERIEFYLKDVCGYAYDVVKAVLAADADDVVDALARAEAVRQVMHMPEFQAIGAACKRMRNILR